MYVIKLTNSGFHVGCPSHMYACLRFENLTQFFTGKHHGMFKTNIILQTCQGIVRMCVRVCQSTNLKTAVML